MQCARCGSEVPQGARECPKCGMTNEFAPEAPAKRGIKPLTIAIIALALVAIIGIALAAVFSARGRGEVTQAPGGNLPPGSVTQLPAGSPPGGDLTNVPPGAPAPPANQPPDARKPKPPQEVVDYLEFVKKVEKHRQMLLKDTGEALMLSQGGSQAASLMAMIDMATDPEGKAAQDPLASTKNELARQFTNWKKTLDYFDQRTAPAQCREFSGAYRQLLYNETVTIGKIAVDFSGVNIMDPNDMSKLLRSLQKMKGDPSIQEKIDESADTADAKLEALVSNFDMEKPFDVPREKQTSGSIMGF